MREFNSHPTTAFSCGARSAFKQRSKKLLEKHAIAPSAARLCFMKGCQEKKHSYLLAVLSFDASPQRNRKLSTRAARVFSSILTSATLRDFSERPRPGLPPRKCRPLFYLRLRLNSSLRLLLSQVVPGGIQFGVVLRCGLVRLATHVTQSLLILPRTCFSISSCWAWFFLCSAGWSLSSLYTAFLRILPASKLSPLFHTASTVADSLRATASLAISSRIPVFSSPS